MVVVATRMDPGKGDIELEEGPLVVGIRRRAIGTLGGGGSGGEVAPEL